MNDAWTSANVSRENKSRARVRSARRGGKELWRLAAVLHTLFTREFAVCESTVCFLSSPILWPSTFVCTENARSALVFVLIFAFPSISSSRSYPLHQWRERKHPPPGGHVIWADGQLQLGGGLQSPDHHPPPHDVRQRGRRRATQHKKNKNKKTTVFPAR